MMKRFTRTQLSRYILATLTMGLFSIAPLAYALPVPDGSYTNTAGSAINTSVANQMGITSTASNNVMNWKTFSIANGEKVQFDTNNYLNLVRGVSKSEINGALTGGGTIYLINPNGILFGSTAQVNVGNLVASTRAIDKVDTSGFAASGANPLATAATAAAGDIVNLGKLQAASVVLEGNNITIQNAADVTSDGTKVLTSAVTLKSDGVITVGHEVSKTTTRNFTISGTAVDKTVHDYANASTGSSGYTAMKLDGTTANAVKESMLVDNVYDLQNMDANLNGNYMLSGNIKAGETSTWSDVGTTNLAGFSPIGTYTTDDSNTFMGTFDGAGYTISGLTINRSSSASVGLFGYTKGTIQNVGLIDGSIIGGSKVGSIAGFNRGTIRQSYNTNTVSGTSQAGGVAGINGGSISNVYNTGTISGTGSYTGGVAGFNAATGTITDSYNTGSVSGTGEVGGVVGGTYSGSIINVYNTGNVMGTSSDVGGVIGWNNNKGTLTNAYNTGTVSSTSSNVGGVIGQNDGSVTDSHNTGNVSGVGYVGGVTGKNFVSIINSNNTGNISGTSSNVGGVTGYNAGSITGTHNTGAVTSTASSFSYVGGVAGNSSSTGSITTSYNTGAISGKSDVGGILGYNQGGKVTDSYNIGSVTGTEMYTGGVVGYNMNGNITSSYNMGSISGGQGVGGVVGNVQRGILASVYNTGTVFGKSWVGGVAGYSKGTVKESYNTGSVTGSSTMTGGVVGDNLGGLITDTYNEGNVTGTGMYVGGIAGYSSGTVTASHNLGNVNSKAGYAGGVAGYNYGGTVSDSYNTGSVTDIEEGTNNNGYVGGVVGSNGKYNVSTSSTVKNVYNTGNVSSNKWPDGGIAGGNFGSLTTAYNTGAISGIRVGGIIGWNSAGTVTDVYNLGDITGSTTGFSGGVVGYNQSGTISNTYSTGSVTGTYMGGVAGANNGTISQAWYATTNASGYINTKNSSGIGTGATLAALQAMTLSEYAFTDATSWRTYAKNGTDTIVATTPMLEAYKNTVLDSYIAHSAVQYGTAATPLVNLYKTTDDATLDMTNLNVASNVGAVVYGHDLTISNFTSHEGDTSTWASYTDGTNGGNLLLKNDNGFTVTSSVQLIGTNSITLTAKDAATGTITDYGTNTTPTLNIKAKAIVLDTDKVQLPSGSSADSTTVTLTATGSAKAGYTPDGTMTATVNGATVTVPDYASAGHRDDYPTINATNNNLSEGQWIKNVTELQAVGETTDTLKGKYFLYSDINASATQTWNKSAGVYQGFVPVGNDDTKFSGTFDGLGYTINDLTINRPTTDYVGLFSSSTGTIQNVGLVGGSITGKDFVGGVLGYNDSGKVTNVYNTGTVNGSSSVGGVLGYNNSGEVTNVYNTGAVSGSSSVGGVLGYNDSGKVTNVYNTGTVSGTGDNVGGVAGYNDRGEVTNVYNTGAVNGTRNNVGGVLGYNDGTITNALWTNDLTYAPETDKTAPKWAVGNQENSDKGETLAKMKQAATYDSWKDNFGNNIVATTGGAGTAWRIYEGNTTPLLTSFFKGVVTVTGLSDQSVTYDGTTQKADLSGAAYSLTTIDDSHILAGGGRNVGTYNAIYSDQQGYDLVDTDTHTLTITPITLTATLIGKTGDTYVFTKTYDGTQSVTKELALGTTYTFDNAVSGDTVSIAANSSGTYANKNVGDGKTISYIGITLTGADAGNYTIANTLSGNVGQITKKDITASLKALGDSYIFTKTYDGTTEVKKPLGDNYSFGAGDIESVDADKVSMTAGVGAYTDKNVGDTKEIIFGELHLGGDEAGNYNLTTTELAGNVGQITSKELTITLAGNNTFTKEYDGTATVNQALAGNYTISGIVGTEKVDIDSAGVSGTYADKNAADGKLVQFTVSGLTGADKDNYNLTSTTLTGNVGEITSKALTATLTGDNVFTKVYDGTTTVSQALGTNYTLDGIVADSDKVSLTAGSGVYNDKNAGDNKTITFSGLTLTGTDAGNYTIASTLSDDVGQITKKSLVAELHNGAGFTKVYDGTTAVNTALVLDGNYAFAEGDVVTGDTVSIDAAKAVGTYADKNAGSNKAVNFTNLTLTGTDAGNYELFDMEMGINGASITPKTLTATLTVDNVFTKVYDGTTTVSQALGTNYALEGIVADSDKVSLTAGSGVYNDKNAGDNKTVTFSGLTLTGTGAGNYNLTTTSLSSNAGQITRKTITGSLTSGYSFDKVYDGTTTASLGNGYTLSGVANGDTVPLTAANGFYDSSAAGDRTVTFSGFSINDGNYLLSMADRLNGTGKITSRSLDHNYSDSLAGVSSFFGANPSDGYTIFSGTPEDYIARAVTQNNGQSYQVGVGQVTQTWYNGPTTITIVNGGIALPKDILLGSTPDTRTVVIKGSGYQI